MAKWVFNDSGSSKTWVGQRIADQAYYLIQAIEQFKWAADSALLADINSGDAIISTTDDSEGHLSSSAGIAHLKIITG